MNATLMLVYSGCPGKYVIERVLSYWHSCRNRPTAYIQTNLMSKVVICDMLFDTLIHCSNVQMLCCHTGGRKLNWCFTRSVVNCLPFYGHRSIKCRTRPVKLLSICPSFYPSEHSATKRRCSRFTVVGPVARRYRWIGTWPAHSSNCKQFHVLS